VIYAVREYAATVIDVLARRTRLAFLNVRAAEESLPRIVELMSRELGWSKQHEQVQTEVYDDDDDAHKFVETVYGVDMDSGLLKGFALVFPLSFFPVKLCVRLN